MAEARPEGVYPSWETYPPDSLVKNDILRLEQVNGDGSVTVFECARSEARVLLRFLVESMPFEAFPMIMATL